MVVDAPCSWVTLSQQFGVRLGGREMVFRTASAIATLLIGLGEAGGQALAQYYPPAQTYPPQGYPQGYPPRQPLPPAADGDDDAPPINAPVVQGPPLPPVGVGPQW